MNSNKVPGEEIDVTGILLCARDQRQASLSEYESKRILQAYGIPVVQETLVGTWQETREAASRIGYPAVLKVCSPEVIHKTEKGLIATNLRDERDLKDAFGRLGNQANELGGSFLVQKMVRGQRELVMGMICDPQFGPCIMFGLGGIFTEMLGEVCFRVAPIGKRDALEMISEIRGYRVLNAVRGMEAVDLDVLCSSLIAIGNIGLEHAVIESIDVNPAILEGAIPIAVDALIVLKKC